MRTDKAPHSQPTPHPEQGDPRVSPDDATRHRTRNHWRHLRAGLRVLSGGLLGVLALVATLFISGAAGAGLTLLVTSSLVTLIPAAALWRKRRGWAVGMGSTWTLAVLAVFVWLPWWTVERAESEVAASGNPAFYFGRQVDGHLLNDYYLANDQSNFFYGSCHPSRYDGEGGCGNWDVSISTFWGYYVTLGGDSMANCTRVESVAGVPTVQVHSATLDDDQLILFTGESRIALDFAGNLDIDQRLAIAREIRPVGQTQPATHLPEPTPNILAFLAQHCGPAR
jgi:hypothetical protein